MFTGLRRVIGCVIRTAGLRLPPSDTHTTLIPGCRRVLRPSGTYGSTYSVGQCHESRRHLSAGGRAGWAVRAPLPGIIIWLGAAWSVVAAVGLAGLTLAVHATALGGGLSHLIGACVLRLRAAYATPDAAWPAT